MQRNRPNAEAVRSDVHNSLIPEEAGLGAEDVDAAIEDFSNRVNAIASRSKQKILTAAAEHVTPEAENRRPPMDTAAEAHWTGSPTTELLHRYVSMRQELIRIRTSTPTTVSSGLEVDSRVNSQSVAPR